MKKVFPLISKFKKSISRNSLPLTIFFYWIFQGMLYMDVREVVFKLLFDLILVIFFMLLKISIVPSILAAHTINMLANGHLIALLGHQNKIRISQERFASYLSFFVRRIRRKRFLRGAAAFGSLSRDSYRQSSDIDLRIFPKKGFFNWLATLFFVIKERCLSLLCVFPLDLYPFTIDNIDKKIKKDEPAIIFLDAHGILLKKFSRYITVDDFLKTFNKNHVQKYRICLISSHGGHLRELLDATAEVSGRKYVVTFKTKNTRELLQKVVHYFVIDPHKSVFKYALNFCQSLRHLFKERPRVVISTGAGIAIPSILLAKFLFKSKIIFIESAANVVNPSKTGRLLYKYADLFLIQWESLRPYYPGALYCGLVI